MRPPMTVPGSRMSAGRVVASAITRITQSGWSRSASASPSCLRARGSDLAYLVGWDLLVGSYLAVGFGVARRRRTRPDPARPGGGIRRVLTSARLSFGLAILASLVGVSSLSSALSYGGNAAYGQAIRSSAARPLSPHGCCCTPGMPVLRLAVLRAGGRRWPAGPGRGGGLEFPATRNPWRPTSSISRSRLAPRSPRRVNVTTQAMRWHVMVHSVLSFFYNAVVLAAAIGFLLGK